MSDQTKTIVVVPAGAGFSITIPGAALRTKRDALAKALPVTQVTNAEEQKTAIAAAATLKGLVSQAEAARKEVKQPYWDAGKAIDAKAAEYVAELEKEAKRIEGLVGGFQRREQEKAEEARREQERKQREADQAAQAERDRLARIERERLAAEEAARNAKGKKAREAAEAEAARLREKADAARIDAMEAEDEAAEAAATVVVEARPAATGASTTFTTEFEVTDIEALYAWDLTRREYMAKALGKQASDIPSVVKMEIKKTDFKYITSTMKDGERDSIPGVTFKQVAKVAVRGVVDQVPF